MTPTPSSLACFLPTACVAALLLPACILDQELGETAEGSGSSSGSSPSDSGTTAADPSATSDPTEGSTDSSNHDSTYGDPGEGTMAGSTTDPTGDPTETGSNEECNPGGTYLTWDQDFLEGIEGVDPSFVAILEGTCDSGATFESTADMGQSWTWELYLLDCMLSGRVDGDGMVVDQPFDITLAGGASEPPGYYLPPLDGGLEVRVVLDWWGMGWNRYFQLYQGGQLVLDMVDAEYVDATDTTWGPEVEAITGGLPWHYPLRALSVDAVCLAGGGDCGEIPRAVELGWDELEAGVTLHGGESGAFDTNVAGLSYEASVTTSQAIPEPFCTDTPLGDYRFAVWAVP